MDGFEHMGELWICIKIEWNDWGRKLERVLINKYPIRR